MGRGRREALPRGTRKLGAHGYVIILIAVMVSWVYTDANIHQLYTLNMCGL